MPARRSLGEGGSLILLAPFFLLIETREPRDFSEQRTDGSDQRLAALAQSTLLGAGVDVWDFFTKGSG